LEGRSMEAVDQESAKEDGCQGHENYCSGQFGRSHAPSTWGRLPTCAPIFNRRNNRRINNPPQDGILPHSLQAPMVRWTWPFKNVNLGFK
jgi:hypothetical protein